MRGDSSGRFNAQGFVGEQLSGHSEKRVMDVLNPLEKKDAHYYQIMEKPRDWKD